MYEQTLQRVTEMGLKSKVHFTGYVAQEDLPAVYSLAEVFVYPSWYEGVGLPVLEAMACGTPVVTSNISSMPEFAGEAGILIDPGSPDQIADALISLLKNPGERAQRSVAGLERAAIFTWERAAQLTFQAIRKVAGNRG